MYRNIIIDLSLEEAHDFLDFLLDTPTNTNETVDKVIEMLQYELEEVEPLDFEYDF